LVPRHTMHNLFCVCLSSLETILVMCTRCASHIIVMLIIMFLVLNNIWSFCYVGSRARMLRTRLHAAWVQHGEGAHASPITWGGGVELLVRLIGQTS
jgi:Gpi18-like mannosyltransferase